MGFPGKDRADFQSKGDWNARCSMCSFKRKASTLVRNWQGMWRCPIHNEPRHPQDYVRGIPDNTNPPWVQPGGQQGVELDLALTTDEATTTVDPTNPNGNIIFLLTDTGNYLLTQD